MKISVYITSYNQKTLLKQAIDSVLAQTLLPSEIIIVDDASSDGSSQLIVEYAKNYPNIIKFFIHEKNLGIAAVRRQALEMVTGDYVTYLDGDDIFAPWKLEIEFSLLENEKYDLVFSNTAYFSNRISNVQWIWVSDLNKLPPPGSFYKPTFLRQLPRQSLFRMELVKMNLLREVGFHDSNLEIYEDYELRIRLTKKAKVNFSLIPLGFVRLDSHTLSKRPNENHLKALDYIFEKHLESFLNEFPDQKNLVINRIKEIRNPYLNEPQKAGKDQWWKFLKKF